MALPHLAGQCGDTNEDVLIGKNLQFLQKQLLKNREKMVY